jgi:hypothetical protein
MVEGGSKIVEHVTGHETPLQVDLRDALRSVYLLPVLRVELAAESLIACVQSVVNRLPQFGEVVVRPLDLASYTR